MTKFHSLGFFFIAVLLSLSLWHWTAKPMLLPGNTEFKTINGQTLSLADLKGKPVLVTFWASDCPSCLEEIPDLIKLHQQHSPQGLTIIAVAMYYDPPNQIVELSRDKRLPYAVALDPDAALANAFGKVQFTPTTYLLDKEGKIVMQKIGRFDLSSISERLISI